VKERRLAVGADPRSGTGLAAPARTGLASRVDPDELGHILDAGRADRLAEVLKVLGNPTRLRIVAYLLCLGEQTVGEIARALGTAQAATSQALVALRLGGQVRVRREGGYHFYTAAEPDLAVMLTCLSRCCRLHGGQTGSPAQMDEAWVQAEGQPWE
jgi:DNA-binding transcriptional ArsR family regulator